MILFLNFGGILDWGLACLILFPFHVSAPPFLNNSAPFFESHLIIDDGAETVSRRLSIKSGADGAVGR